MKNIKMNLILLTQLIRIDAAERPPQSPKNLPTFLNMVKKAENKQEIEAWKKKLARLPRDVQRMVIVEHLLTLYPNLTKWLDTLLQSKK